ncbi:Flp pilus assembly complex ATPase component TadA, partial [Candidatus Dojkabacteria bacterium]|nr:Flp pilus assembly complex ATPase component TadA [Candidatus Dojkabacteria bacterium]
GMHEDAESWDQALKSILRQDPDVVLIGEMRDLETISSAMTIAETGHLVFATLHTNDAAQTMDRIIDVFPEHQQNQIRTQLANVLTAVISQKLVPINAGGGRRVAVELLISTSAVQSAIREAKVHQIDNIIQTSAEIGMISMEKSLVNMVRQGLISPEQAQQFANKPNDVIALLK